MGGSTSQLLQEISVADQRIAQLAGLSKLSRKQLNELEQLRGYAASLRARVNPPAPVHR